MGHQGGRHGTEGMKVHKSGDWDVIASAIVITSVAVTVWVRLLALGDIGGQTRRHGHNAEQIRQRQDLDYWDN